MHLSKEKLEIDENIKRKVRYILKFLNINERITNGNLISIDKTNIAYIEPHKLKINGICYLFFNECENVYINTLENYIHISELESYIKNHRK